MSLLTRYYDPCYHPASPPPAENVEDGVIERSQSKHRDLAAFRVLLQCRGREVATARAWQDDRRGRGESDERGEEKRKRQADILQ
eukprot:750624-Hanusia_phi.AAC.4